MSIIQIYYPLKVICTIYHCDGRWISNPRTS